MTERDNRTIAKVYKPADRLESQLWAPATRAVICYDPNALAGLGIFHLPKDHWLTDGARVHDPIYVAKEQGELPDEAKGWGDCLFMERCHINARAMTLPYIKQDYSNFYEQYNKLAELYTELAFAWLAIRSPIGEVAWRT